MVYEIGILGIYIALSRYIYPFLVQFYCFEIRIILAPIYVVQCGTIVV